MHLSVLRSSFAVNKHSWSSASLLTLYAYCESITVHLAINFTKLENPQSLACYHRMMAEVWHDIVRAGLPEQDLGASSQCCKTLTWCFSCDVKAHLLPATLIQHSQKLTKQQWSMSESHLLHKYQVIGDMNMKTSVVALHYNDHNQQYTRHELSYVMQTAISTVHFDRSMLQQCLYGNLVKNRAQTPKPCYTLYDWVPILCIPWALRAVVTATQHANSCCALNPSRWALIIGKSYYGTRQFCAWLLQWIEIGSLDSAMAFS